MVKTSRTRASAIIVLPFVAVLGLMSTLGPLLPGDSEADNPGDILGEHQHSVHGVAFTPDGKTLASGGGFPGKEGELKLWDVPMGRLRANLSGHEQCVYAATFSPDGRTLATASFDGIVKLWDVASAREIASVSIAREYSGLPVAFSAVGEVLALTGCRPGLVMPGCEVGEVMLWRRTWDAKSTLASGMVPVALGSDGRDLALCRVNLGPQSPRHHAEREERTGTCEYGCLLADAFWDVAIRHPTLILKGHQDYVCSLAFSPNGHTLASASSDMTIRLWDVTVGRERTVLRGHTAQVNGVAFTADGRLLASASHDRTVRLWDVATGWEKGILQGHGGAVTCVAFDPGRQWVASGSYDKTVRLWRMGQ